ncbi:MAG TPA: sugar phosphate isomerase/epimerase family protein [Planctomycetota bacterium]|nr:sugar phosphate isomerase/epimerase family protein [Planctomycetota bacterium]
MKVGHMLMTDPRDPQGNVLPWRQFLAQARGWGLQGVDLFPAYLERAGATVDEAARVIADLGLRIAVLCVPTDLVSADPAVREQSLDRVRAFADNAVELGVTHLFSYGGQHANRGEEALRRYVDGLQRAADLCAERGLLFSIENAGSLCHTHEEMARCLDAVARPNTRLTIDTGNFVLAGSDPHEAIRRLAPRVAHVHVKNFVDAPGRTPWPYRYCSPRAGKVDYAYVVEQLRAVGYQGHVSFEPEGFPDAQAEDGIRFLAELLAKT